MPLPGTVTGYYVARARIIDQSGNQSSATDPNAQANFVVDTAAPTVSVTNPGRQQRDQRLDRPVRASPCRPTRTWT